jgi:hypothetical protein
LSKLSCIAFIVLLLICPRIQAQVILDLDPCCTPGSFQDIGNIASDGSGGRQSVVRPLDQGEGSGYIFFENYLSAEGRYADPPATPSQTNIVLIAGEPLALALPQLQHFPEGATVSVEHSTIGNQVEVDASIHFLGYSTDWFAPPHEYIHALGAFTPGDYRLTLDLIRSDWFYLDEPSVTRGFIDFTVVAVPEPSIWLIAASAITCALSRRLGRV